MTAGRPGPPARGGVTSSTEVRPGLPTVPPRRRGLSPRTRSVPPFGAAASAPHTRPRRASRLPRPCERRTWKGAERLRGALLLLAATPAPRRSEPRRDPRAGRSEPRRDPRAGRSEPRSGSAEELLCIGPCELVLCGRTHPGAGGSPETRGSQVCGHSSVSLPVCPAVSRDRLATLHLGVAEQCASTQQLGAGLQSDCSVWLGHFVGPQGAAHTGCAGRCSRRSHGRRSLGDPPGTDALPGAPASLLPASEVACGRCII